MSSDNLTAGERRAVRNAFEVQRRRAVIELASTSGNVSKTCRRMNMPRATFYRWKARYDQEGVAGLANRPSGTKGHPWSTPPDVIEKIVHLRKTYHLGPQRITWYLERYHGITVSCSTHVVDRFPFRIHTIRTDRGHEFQALFHWHVEDQGMRHVYIKPRTPQLNGKVELSHRTDQEEFYQLLSFTEMSISTQSSPSGSDSTITTDLTERSAAGLPTRPCVT